MANKESNLNTTKEQERAELHRAIWQIANDLRGNVDADLVLQAMIDYPNYANAVLVSSDGDFYSLARYLYDNNKLLAVLSPHRKTCSSLLIKSAKDKMVYMDTLREKSAKRKSTA